MTVEKVIPDAACHAWPRRQYQNAFQHPLIRSLRDNLLPPRPLFGGEAVLSLCFTYPFIPTCSDRDPFHRDYFARRQGALCAAVPALQAKRNAAFGQKNPAFGGMKPAIGCVAALARMNRFDAMK
jgi:hypothetical protein